MDEERGGTGRSRGPNRSGSPPPELAREGREGLQMAPEFMRELARQAADILVQRHEGLRAEDSWDGDFRQSLEGSLLEDPPEHGQPAGDVLKRAQHEVLRFATRLDHPRCFAFVPSSPTWPGVLADFLAAGYNINAVNWLVASGPSQLELVVLEWFRRWLGFPEGAGGIFTSGGSSATLNAFVAAREAAGNPERPVVYLSDQTHGSIARAARIIGVRVDRVRVLPSHGLRGLDLDALRATVREDRTAGLDPIVVSANAGSGSTGAVDPLDELADYCTPEGLWLHVDAAYGGFATLTDHGKRLLRGIERADSVGLDPHKWFFQGYETGCLIVRDTRALEGAFAVRPDVLQDTIWGANHPNLVDRSLQTSRSFRALKVWMSVQTFGMAAFRRAVQQGIDLAAQAEDFVEASPDLELTSPAQLGILCFRANPGDALGEPALEQINRKVLARVFWEEPALASSTNVGGAFTLRLCILNHTTTWDDVRETLEAIARFGREAVDGLEPEPAKETNGSVSS